MKINKKKMKLKETVRRTFHINHYHNEPLKSSKSYSDISSSDVLPDPNYKNNMKADGKNQYHVILNEDSKTYKLFFGYWFALQSKHICKITDDVPIFIQSDMNKMGYTFSNDVKRYTGKAWKHHVSEHFESGETPTHPNGAGAGATIFTDFEKMMEYLQWDGRRWHVCELDLCDEILNYEFGCDYMATVYNDIESKEGFKPIAK